MLVSISIHVSIISLNYSAELAHQSQGTTQERKEGWLAGWLAALIFH